MFTLFVVLLSFFLPTQFGYHFTNLSPSVYGFRIDYLIPTLYLTDILAVLVITMGLRNIKWNKSLFWKLGLLTFLILVNVSSSSLVIPASYKWFKIVESFLLVLVLKDSNKLNIFENIYIPLSLSMVAIMPLGIVQTIIGHSLGGLFYYLGERTFSVDSFGISTVQAWGREILRAYSTFSHPNSFAGFIMVFALLTWYFKNRLKKWYVATLSVLITISLVFTFSLNALITLLFLILTYLFRLKNRLLILSMLLLVTMFTFYTPVTKLREIDYRVDLAKASFAMFKQNPVVGVGLNNFIPTLATKSAIFKNAWELQPVHNIYLLILAETGLLGLILSLVFLSTLTLTPFLLAILFSGLFDHYWLTLQQNMLLFSLVIAFSFAKLNSWKIKK